MIVLGFDTATPATAVGLRLATASRSRRATTRRRASVPATPRGCWRWPPSCSREPALAGGRSSGSRSGLGPAPSRACASASPPRAASRSRWRSSWSGSSSLRALAAGGARLRRRRSGAGVLAVIDARRGEVFAAAYERGDDGLPRELSGPRARWRPSALRGVLAGSVERSRRGRPATLAGRRRRRGALPRAARGAGVAVPPERSPLHRVERRGDLRAAATRARARPSTRTVAARLPAPARRGDRLGGRRALRGATSSRERAMTRRQPPSPRPTAPSRDPAARATPTCRR